MKPSMDVPTQAKLARTVKWLWVLLEWKTKGHSKVDADSFSGKDFERHVHSGTWI